MTSLSFSQIHLSALQLCTGKARKTTHYHACWWDKTRNLLLFAPLRRSLNVAEYFFPHSWRRRGIWLPSRSPPAARASRSGDIGTSRDPPPPATVRFAKIHLKESDFRARRENSFLTLITSLHCEDLMFCSEINFPAGALFKEFRCTFLSSMVSGSCENWLWINCEYHLPDFLFGYLPNVDRSLNGHLPSATHYGAFLRRCICAGWLACFMAFSTAALKHEWAFVSRLYLEEFRREQIL